MKSPRSNFRDAGSPGKDEHTPPGAGTAPARWGRQYGALLRTNFMGAQLLEWAWLLPGAVSE